MSNVVTKNPPKAGELLLAEPFLFDSNFKRAVILLAECNEDGAVGFVLNKPLEITLQSVVEDVGDFGAGLLFGGPVEPNTLHYLHNLGDAIDGSMEIVPGLFWGGSFESVKALITQGQLREEDIKFFVGYSGWGAGQLEVEMEEKSWIKTTLSPDQILSYKPASLWKEILINLGGKFKVMSGFPESPILN